MLKTWHFCFKTFIMKMSPVVKSIAAVTAILICFFLTALTPAKSKKRVLIFSKTNGFHHASIAVGIPAIIKLGMENNFEVDTTTDSLSFNPDNLKKYSVLVFLSPTGKVFGLMKKKLCRTTFIMAEVLWASMQQRIASTTGNGMEIWSEDILNLTQNNSRQNLWLLIRIIHQLHIYPMFGKDLMSCIISNT